MAKDKQIPAEYRDLLDRPIVVSLATINPSGQPQVTPVWCDYDGEYVRVNSAGGRRKVKNMEARPQVTVLAIDPENHYRWIEVQGVIEVINNNQDEAVAHINKLSNDYDGNPDFFSNKPDLRNMQERFIFNIKPMHVIANG
ncbi:MAG: PPOX class F420-dependent oxidoreductase [Anaerolineae bacterium]|nr:PPOX class F420-dependent oxidoreductase [Anaerolineae bacterium]